MFGELVVNQNILFQFRLETDNKTNFLYSGTAVGFLMIATVFKQIKGEDASAFRLFASCGVGNAGTLATTANAVLMRDSAEAEIQFCLDLCCFLSLLNIHTGIWHSVREDRLWRTQNTR